MTKHAPPAEPGGAAREDTARDVLGFAVKPEPRHQMPQAASAHDTSWDFVSPMPESTHMLMWVMSDRGIPCSYATMQGFVTVPERLAAQQEQSKLRGKPEKFAEHYNQATLFFDSQTSVEQAHIAAAFRFELSKLTVPAIRQRMVSSLRNVSETLAQQVADGLGTRPDPMPCASIAQWRV